MKQVLVSEEMLRQVIDSLEATCGHRCNAEYNPCNEQELVWQLRNALEQPAAESLTVHQIRLSDATWVNCCETTFDYHNSMGWKTRTLQTCAALEQPEIEPVSHQYQDSSGKWCNFMNESHYVNTKADGRWPIRALYAAPQAQQPASVQECKHCTKFFSAYRCNASQGECDCPKCQGFCTCSQQTKVTE